MKKSVSVLIGLLLSVSASGQVVGPNGVQITGVRISAGAVQLVGTILTSSSDNLKGAEAIGWTLILLGSFSQGGDIAIGQELYNKETEVALFNEGQSLADAKIRANVKKVLQDTEMEALVAANDPKLASSLTIGEFAQSLNLSSERLGQAVVRGKAFADAKLAGAQFASSLVPVSRTELTAGTGPLSDSEAKVITNYLRLRNISVI